MVPARVEGLEAAQQIERTGDAMTRDELLQQLRIGESEDFEVKAAQRGVPDDAYKTVSAFANCSL